MATVESIIRLWPRPIDLARELGVGPSRIADWKNRNAIPVAYWQRILQAARRRGHPEVTAELLVKLHARVSLTEPQGFCEEGTPWVAEATPLAQPGQASSKEDLIRLWPTLIDLARELGVRPSRITDWKNRNAIPVAYWESILEAAHWRGHSEVTAELLVQLHAGEPAALPQSLGEEERPGVAQPGQTSSQENVEPEAIGHFSRFKHLRQANFASADDITAHISALRDE